jgi:glycosyltransferase involved in cell wall biosynthesis
MDASIVICTCDRADLLRQALKHLAASSLPRECTCEVIVVDNNSSDHTSDVVEEFKGESACAVRYVFECEPGLSNARNSGVRQAAGDLVIFTDDDVRVSEHWLAKFGVAFRETEADCIGGRILPDWEVPPPKWLGQELYNQLALLDLGRERIQVDRPCLWGANVGFRRSVFEEHGMFNTSLGRRPGRLYAGEESDMIRRVLGGGGSAWYCPELLVHHRIPVSRMRKSYFRKWRYDQGRLEASQSAARVSGALVLSIIDLVRLVAVYLAAIPAGQRGAFLAELRALRKAGNVAGLLSHKG